MFFDTLTVAIAYNPTVLTLFTTLHSRHLRLSLLSSFSKVSTRSTQATRSPSSAASSRSSPASTSSTCLAKTPTAINSESAVEAATRLVAATAKSTASLQTDSLDYRLVSACKAVEAATTVTGAATLGECAVPLCIRRAAAEIPEST